MDTLAIIIIAGLVTIIILVLIARNTILSNRIEDAHIENDRQKRENHSLEKKNDEHNDELREQLKKMMTIVALMCAVTFQVNAQNSDEQLQKKALEVVLEAAMVETPEWNMEQPVVGWLVPKLRLALQGKDAKKEGDIVLIETDDRNATPRIIKSDATVKPQFEVNFSQDANDEHALSVPAESARLMFVYGTGYHEILAKYREFKAGK